VYRCDGTTNDLKLLLTGQVAFLHEDEPRVKLPSPCEPDEVLDVAGHEHAVFSEGPFEEDIVGRSEEPAISNVDGVEAVLHAKPFRDLRGEVLVKQELVGHEAAPSEGRPS